MNEKNKIYDDKMTKTINNLDGELATIRAGRANPHVLDKLAVDYYGTPTPIQQVANVSVPEARMIQIQPWEKSMLKAIEKAILTSDIGINPTNDGTSIRLVFPELTEERRKELVKDVKKKGEASKVAVRNIRRDGNDAFKKLKFEANFQKLSPGGAISYVEVPNMQDNLDAVLSVMKFIYENIMYAELNTKSDYCQVCGYDGEIQIVKDDDGKLVWECPHCHNRDQDKMNVARRTCGYIGSQFWNQGRTQEIKERVLHL